MVEKEEKTDYLKVDDPIAGQNYACISFISPEDLIQDRMGFRAVKFMQSFFKDQDLDFNDVYEQYKDFVYKHDDKLQRDFDEQNNFRTSIRGVKVRGVFDTMESARDKAKKLSLTDSGIHTFIGQVGYWLPWDPTADKVGDEVFQNAELNTLMEKYEENNINRDIFYDEQKRDKMKAAQEEKLKAQAEERAAKKAKEIENLEPEPEPEPELDQEPEPETKAESLESKVEDVNSGPRSTNVVDKDLVKSLDETDPWLQRKQEEKQ